jgi:hypothetical protein
MGEGKGEEMTQTLYASMNKTKNKKSFKNKKKKDKLAYSYNYSTWEVEAGRLSSRIACIAYKV